MCTSSQNSVYAHLASAYPGVALAMSVSINPGHWPQTLDIPDSAHAIATTDRIHRWQYWWLERWKPQTWSESHVLDWLRKWCFQRVLEIQCFRTIVYKYLKWPLIDVTSLVSDRCANVPGEMTGLPGWWHAWLECWRSQTRSVSYFIAMHLTGYRNERSSSWRAVPRQGSKPVPTCS